MAFEPCRFHFCVCVCAAQHFRGSGSSRKQETLKSHREPSRRGRRGLFRRLGGRVAFGPEFSPNRRGLNGWTRADFQRWGVGGKRKGLCNLSGSNLKNITGNETLPHFPALSSKGKSNTPIPDSGQTQVPGKPPSERKTFPTTSTAVCPPPRDWYSEVDCFKRGRFRTGDAGRTQGRCIVQAYPGVQLQRVRTRVLIPAGELCLQH